MTLTRILILAAFGLLAWFLLSGCTADGSFDGAAFRQVVGAATDTYRAYEDEQRRYQPAPTTIVVP